ncbi:hypothetical protein GCM10017559_71160 [Streptosporangium longisporum]|uniref:Activator of Hsp90 ATPase homologue 1/2-like C-terminal domain-containing protein n=1 Tax=Streptosporangium longisporum TaxID=46187 RepID=A0ABP6L5Q6_9ACTN
MDRIEHEIFIDATVEHVWRLLTQAEHIRAWFAFDGADIDLRPGGDAGPHLEGARLLPGRHRAGSSGPPGLSYRYSSVPDEGSTTGTPDPW